MPPKGGRGRGGGAGAKRGGRGGTPAAQSNPPAEEPRKRGRPRKVEAPAIVDVDPPAPPPPTAEPRKRGRPKKVVEAPKVASDDEVEVLQPPKQTRPEVARPKQEPRVTVTLTDDSPTVKTPKPAMHSFFGPRTAKPVAKPVKTTADEKLPPEERLNQLTQAIVSTKEEPLNAAAADHMTTELPADEACTDGPVNSSVRPYLSRSANCFVVPQDATASATQPPALTNNSDSVIEVHPTIADPVFDDAHPPKLPPSIMTAGGQLFFACCQAVIPDVAMADLDPKALRYAESYHMSMKAVAASSASSSMWCQKYPFPCFPGTDHDAALNHFVSWVQSWQRAGENSDDSDSSTSPASTPATPPRPPARVVGTPSPKYDEHGVRLRRRRQEQLARERAAHEATVSKLKGYFKTRDERGFVRRLSTTTNIAVMSGDLGVGKSALIAEIAKQTSSQVIEIHTGVNRSATNIEKLFREATQAKRVSTTKDDEAKRRSALQSSLAQIEKAERERKAEKERQARQAAAAAAAKGRGSKKPGKLNGDTLAQFFSKRGSKKEQQQEPTAPAPPEPAVEIVDEPATGSAAVSSPLVVVDSADVSLPDEPGFASAVRKIAAETKFPIIVTVNRILTPEQLQSAYGSEHVPQLRIEQPTAHIVLFYAMVVLAIEQPQVKVDPVDVLAFIRAQGQRGCDPRAVLLDLQWHFLIDAPLRPVDAPPVIPPFSRLQIDLVGTADPVVRCQLEVRDVVSRCQTVEFFSRIKRSSLANPDAFDDDDEEGLDWDAVRPLWERDNPDAIDNAWHTLDGLLIEENSIEMERTVALGAPRERFDLGAWTLGAGDAIERDEIMREVSKDRKKTVRLFVHAAECSATLIDLVSMKR